VGTGQLALNFSVAVTRKIAEEVERLKPAMHDAGYRVAWVPAANLHLTIRFLGHVDLALAEGIADRLTAADLPAFDLELGDLGTFKRGRMARVVWVGLRTGSEAISGLAAQVEVECGRAGLEAEARRFHAHLTLARARPRDGAVLPTPPLSPELPAWRAAELVLYRSRLGRSGSAYEPLRRIKLG